MITILYTPGSSKNIYYRWKSLSLFRNADNLDPADDILLYFREDNSGVIKPIQNSTLTPVSTF